MRLITLSKLLVLAGAVALAYKNRDRLARPAAMRRGGQVGQPGLAATDLIPDPADPVQGFQEATDLQVADLAVDALAIADAEAAQDLAALENDIEYDERAVELDTPSQTTFDAVDQAIGKDAGELYGVHTPPAVDRTIPDDSAAMNEGQNWIEALETSAVEYGAEPERELDVIDDADRPPHPTDTRDIPVADRGSGGPSGV
jgi:hypothetical protein